MKEIHKILEKKIGLALSPLGYKKASEMKWYLPVGEFSRGVEIQRSQWSDEVYVNLYAYIDSSNDKPNKSTPYLTTRIGGVDVCTSDAEFNEVLDLSKGDIYEKTNKIAEYILIALDNTLNKLNSLEDVKFWLENKSFEKDGEFRFAHTSGNNVFETLGIDE